MQLLLTGPQDKAGYSRGSDPQLDNFTGRKLTAPAVKAGAVPHL